MRVYNGSITEKRVDQIHRSLGLGGISTQTYSVLNGIRVAGGTLPVPPNTDVQGITFFTRPCLNLSYHNVTAIRTLAFLADRTPDSMACAVRCMLNPPNYDRYISGTPDVAGYGDDSRSDIIDDRNPFIPLLSNTLLSLSGWRDYAPDVWDSKESFSKSQVSWVQSNLRDYSTFELTAVFANIEGDPISALFTVWLEYATAVSEGSMLPFPINIVENRVDYQTRIYELITDRSGRFLQHIASTGASFPMAVPRGAALNFNREQPITTANDKISIPFKCMGAIYDDPITVQMFNRSVWLSNPDMHPDSIAEKMVKIQFDNLKLFDNKCYPRIADSLEIEWWATQAVYDEITTLIGDKL